jgi:hypothetical protein
MNPKSENSSKSDPKTAKPAKSKAEREAPQSAPDAPGGAAQAAKGGRRRKPFNRPVDLPIGSHREGCKRAWVIATLTTTGATYAEVSEACEWGLRDCYEGITLIHKIQGYGLYEDRNGVIRAYTDEAKRAADMAADQKARAAEQNAA